MMTIQKVLQAGLGHRSESVAEPQVHVDVHEEAFELGAFSDILLLSPGQVDWLCHPFMECSHLGLQRLQEQQFG